MTNRRPILRITPEFASGLQTSDHPVITLCTALIIAGLAWVGIILMIRKHPATQIKLLALFLLLGVGLRLIFFGSTPVYENDYKRYLWDGSVVASGENPYRFSPLEVFEAGEPGASSVPDLARLAIRSNEANYLTGEINSATLTTIYPPAAQAVFTAAYWIAPYEKWGLKLVFLIVEILGFAAIIAGLRARNLPLIWSSAYWLNPIIIFTTYNGIHMDVLLVAPLMAALLWIGRHPIRAAVMLSLAAAVKIWPLLLAPVLFRQWRSRPVLYIVIAALIGALTLLNLLPMLLSLKPSSGLTAYSANWTNSSFLFPGIRDGLGLFMDNPDRTARYAIALILTAFSFWLGFLKPSNSNTLPAYLMLFLTLGAAAYFARFKIGEAGHYDIYTKILLPLEFGIPMLVLAWDGLKARRHVQT